MVSVGVWHLGVAEALLGTEGEVPLALLAGLQAASAHPVVRADLQAVQGGSQADLQAALEVDVAGLGVGLTGM